MEACRREVLTPGKNLELLKTPSKAKIAAAIRRVCNA